QSSRLLTLIPPFVCGIVQRRRFRVCLSLCPLCLCGESLMPDRPFVHLHCHSHYSLLDGANRLPELAAHVKAQGMNAVALTDHGNLYGAVEFYRECTAAGVNPVIGYEAYVAPGRRNDRDARKRGDAGYHLTLLAK